jgi:transketolase
VAIESTRTPTVIILTRQNVANQPLSSYEGLIKGAYVISPESKKLDGILLACGSEVDLAVQTQQVLKEQGQDVRVVSMPSHSMFEMQSSSYQKQILPRRTKILAIEMGSSQSWYKYTQHVYGIDTFGISAPSEIALEHFGFMKEKVAEYFLKKLA